MKNYAIHPGYVMSAIDRDKHFISYNQLIQLYGVDSKNCFEWLPEHDRTVKEDNYIHLHPRHDGDYSLPKKRVR